MKKIITTLIILGVILHADGGLLSVKWPQKSNLQSKIQRSYPDSLKKKISEVKLPVLLPKAYIFHPKISIVSDKNFYSITIFLKGANLVISGDKSYQLEMKELSVNSQKMLKRVKQEFVASEGMMITDFSRYGVNYSMMLECDALEKDSRCSDTEFLKKAFKDLTLVGGKR